MTIEFYRAFKEEEKKRLEQRSGNALPLRVRDVNPALNTSRQIFELMRAIDEKDEKSREDLLAFAVLYHSSAAFDLYFTVFYPTDPAEIREYAVKAASECCSDKWLALWKKKGIPVDYEFPEHDKKEYAEEKHGITAEAFVEEAFLYLKQLGLPFKDDEQILAQSWLITRLFDDDFSDMLRSDVVRMLDPKINYCMEAAYEIIGEGLMEGFVSELEVGIKIPYQDYMRFRGDSKETRIDGEDEFFFHRDH